MYHTAVPVAFFCVQVFLVEGIRQLRGESGNRQVKHRKDPTQNAKLGIVIDQPTTIDQRAEAAEVCVLALNLEMPMLLDDMTNQIEKAYRAWPDRLFVLDAEGRITYTNGSYY